MMSMFIKHSQTISQDKQNEIEHSFLLVFSKVDQISEINRERITQHYEQMEKDKEDKKQRIYRQMADDQLRGLISLMNIDNFLNEGDDKNIKMIPGSTTSRQSQLSTETISDYYPDEEEAMEILNDLQDRDRNSTVKFKSRYQELIAHYSTNV